MNNNVLLAFGLTLLAGLSTGIGSAIAFFAKKTNKRFLSFALGLSAGVMVYVSFAEILPKAEENLIASFGKVQGHWLAVLSFFIGIILIGVIDRLVPSFENPHEIKKVEDINKSEIEEKSKLLRMGMFSALAIGIHNFPEGLATFISTINDPVAGLAIAIAIAIHNIPEGIAVSVPIYYATRSKKRAFKLSFLSGLAEPLGAVIGYLILLPIMTDAIFGFLYGGVAGIMVFISLDELLPTAQEYEEHHAAITGVVIGMGIMAISLLLFI